MVIEILELGIKFWVEILISVDDYNKIVLFDFIWIGIKVGERE